MKLLFALLTSSLLSWAVAPSWWGQSPHHRTSVVVTDSNTTYQLVADYNAAQSPRVIQYLNDCLRPEPALSATQDLDAHLTLLDHTSLTVRAAPGRLRLTLAKQANSAASLERIRQLVPELTRRINSTTP